MIVRHWALFAIFTAVAVMGTAVAVMGFDSPGTVLRGHLRQNGAQPPAIETSGHQHVALQGDEPTMLVLNDERLKDADIEVVGRFLSPEKFELNKIHVPSIFLYRNGKRLQVSYWCDVCYIRTSSPGKCWCCQKQTDLDPIEPES
jgi:hypothetical protein